MTWDMKFALMLSFPVFLVIFIVTEKGFYCLLLMHSSYQNGPQDSLNLSYFVSWVSARCNSLHSSTTDMGLVQHAVCLFMS